MKKDYYFTLTRILTRCRRPKGAMSGWRMAAFHYLNRKEYGMIRECFARALGKDERRIASYVKRLPRRDALEVLHENYFFLNAFLDGKGQNELLCEAGEEMYEGVWQILEMGLTEKGKRKGEWSLSIEMWDLRGIAELLAEYHFITIETFNLYALSIVGMCEDTFFNEERREQYEKIAAEWHQQSPTLFQEFSTALQKDYSEFYVRSIKNIWEQMSKLNVKDEILLEYKEKMDGFLATHVIEEPEEVV